MWCQSVKDLTEIALEKCTSEGASYADIRIVTVNDENISLKKGTLDVLNLQTISGFGIRTIAEMARYNSRCKVTVRIEPVISDSIVESLSTLLLYGVIEMPRGFMEKLTDNEKKYMDFSSNTRQAHCGRHELGYLDQITSLQSGKVASRMSEYFETNYSEAEEIMLEALRLDVDDYNS